MKKTIGLLGVAFALLTFLSPLAHAAEPTPNAAPTTTKEEDANGYDKFIHKVGVLGPKQITLRKLATLDLPEGYAFIPEDVARKVMARMGNQTGEEFVGLIMPVKEDVWFTTVEYDASGHINDDDAKNWDADKLLDGIRTNTEASNKERINQGIPAMEILGWIEKPHYDEATHRLIWSISARNKGATSNEGNTINYRTLMLGREGYFSMTMVTDEAKIEAQKPIANLLLSKLNFTGGKNYSDFNASTDRIAEYGLAALVAGVAAKKIGLFSIAALFIAKYIKLGLVAIAAIMAGWRRRFGKGKTAPVTTPTTIAATPPTLSPPSPNTPPNDDPLL